MAGESQQIPDHAPDPSVYVQAAIDRSSKSEREWTVAQLRVLSERLDGIDRATQLLNETVNRTPTDIQKEILHLRELTTEHFDSIALQFVERDVRAEREARDNTKAVDAAFAAQKEAAQKQDDANAKAIDKSEKATAETIKTNQEVGNKVTDAIRDQLNDLKTKVDRMEARTNGSIEQRTESRQSNAAFYATVGMGLTLILAAITIIGFIAANKP